MLKRIIVIVLVLIVKTSFSQSKKDKVLFTVDNDNVYQSEFVYVFNKNKDIVTEDNKKSIDEYLNLFIDYKLKLKDAYKIKLDTLPAYVKEFSKYKKQLIEPYLKDKKVTSELVKEAYNRKKYEIKASHILIQLKANAKPSDTLEAYNKLMEARNLILNGQSFESVAKKYSEDPSVKQNGGNLGYFTVFNLVYPFETMAYKTKVGDISMPFKTQFGYHIVQVNDKRLSQGTVKVAHIMIREKKGNPKYAENKINEIYNKYKQGEKFETLAKKYSDDKISAAKGGVLKPFSQGRMVQPFGNIAFSLTEENNISKPFKTKYGWHFIKFLGKQPIPEFNKIKKELTKKVEIGDRAYKVSNTIAKRLKKEYKVKMDQKVLNEFLSADNRNKFTTKNWLTINSKTHTTKELNTYLARKTDKDYSDFVNEKMMDYYKNNLEFTNKEFAKTLKEYREGLLLFDLLQQKIWQKAEKDTLGLKSFYLKNKENYKWKKRVDVLVANCTRIEKAELVKKLMLEGLTKQEIKDKVNEGATIHVLFNEGVFEKNNPKLPHLDTYNVGVSKVITSSNKKNFSVLKVKKVLPEQIKALEETKGKVISDYQSFLEKNWIKSLRKEHKVVIHKKVLKKLKKKLKE